MEALRPHSLVAARLPRTSFENPILHLPFSWVPKSSFPPVPQNTGKSRVFTAVFSSVSTEHMNPFKPEVQSDSQDEKFNWLLQWYPIMPVCDLDKRVPHAKKVIGLDVVVWLDRNENDWKVFNDMCPHRLAPLSEGRIDQWGSLQCIYHGWCFNGSGHCEFIPQAAPDDPPVHTFKKACVSVYPSTVQNGIVWFWPNTDPQYKDILMKSKPPHIPELDDPSYARSMGNRDIPYGYEVLIENLMDPAHVPYAHYGIMKVPSPTKNKADEEGGRPLEMKIEKLDHSGFVGKEEGGTSKFIPPCVYYASSDIFIDKNNVSTSSTEKEKEAQRRILLIFICIPVSPGNSRLIWTFPRNFMVWVDRVVPRWMFHVRENLVLDSDLYLLHVEERKIMDIGPSNWKKACFVPTKSDAFVVGFRTWLNKYAGGQVEWATKFSGALSPTPPREQLMDRYWSHVVNCSSCRGAFKGLNVLKVVLEVVAVALIGIVAATATATATEESFMPVAARSELVSMAVVCFAASRWLSHFVHKTFEFHDYHHGPR